MSTAFGTRYPGPASLYEYDLFSVVCHEGQIDNGHYTCFTRHQDEVRALKLHSFDVKTDSMYISGTAMMTRSERSPKPIITYCVLTHAHQSNAFYFGRMSEFAGIHVFLCKTSSRLQALVHAIVREDTRGRSGQGEGARARKGSRANERG